MRRQARRNLLAAVSVAAVGVAGVLVAQGALAGLGVSDATGRQIVEGWLSSGYINASPAAKALKSAGPASRAELVRNAIAWARAYTQSPAFKTEYERQRQANRPSPPDVKGSVDEELARQSAERKKSVEEMKKSLAQFPPDTRQSMEAVVKEAEANNTKLDTDPQMVAMFRQGIEAQRAGEQEAYKGRMAAYEKRWPADSKVLVARRLQEFLDISTDVDFDAKLVPAGRLMRFAEPRYEEKPPIWKLCYRAGREACGAARDAAQAWLKAVG
jgi:hypothetical protein